MPILPIATLTTVLPGTLLVLLSFRVLALRGNTLTLLVLPLLVFLGINFLGLNRAKVVWISL